LLLVLGLGHAVVVHAPLVVVPGLVGAVLLKKWNDSAFFNLIEDG
jgi:hypothetical protein